MPIPACTISVLTAIVRRSPGPSGKTVAVWISPNIEFYELDPPANPHRKS